MKVTKHTMAITAVRSFASTSFKAFVAGERAAHAPPVDSLINRKSRIALTNENWKKRTEKKTKLKEKESSRDRIKASNNMFARHTKVRSGPLRQFSGRARARLSVSQLAHRYYYYKRIGRYTCTVFAVNAVRTGPREIFHYTNLESPAPCTTYR